MSGFPIPTDAPAWSPAATIYLKVWIVSTIISAMAYGGVVSLALSYIPLLLKTSNDISRSMRNFLLFYVTFMVAVSTIYIITMTVALTNNMFFPLDWSKEVYVYQNGRWGEFCVTLASWGADGFMLWRCAILYQGISRPRWILLLTLLSCLGSMSFVGGLIFLCIHFFVFPNDLDFTVVLMSSTILLNLVTATLITLRILYHQRSSRKTAGLASSNPYNTVLVICLESSALIIVISAIFLIISSLRVKYYFMIPMQLLVPIYVLSPLLIVYRVARGKAVKFRPSEAGPAVSSWGYGASSLSSAGVSR